MGKELLVCAYSTGPLGLVLVCSYPIYLLQFFQESKVYRREVFWKFIREWTVHYLATFVCIVYLILW